MNNKSNNLKPKVVVVFHSANIQSGATRSLMDIVDNLILLDKYNIMGIFPEREGTAINYLKEKYGIEVMSFRYGNLMQDLTQPLAKRCVKFLFQIVRHFKIKLEAKKAAAILSKEDISLVYSNTSSIVFGGYLGRFLNCKQVWHIREFRVRDHKIKFYLGERWIKKFIDACASKVMYVSRAVMKENCNIISEEKSVVTYNSYNESFIQPKAAFNVSDGLRVMLAGDIKESKGQLIVAKAVQKIRENCSDYKIESFLAGRESNKRYYQQLLQYIEDNKLQDIIHLLGQVSDMKSLRAGMDVGIVASECEAFGRTTIEGMLSMLAMIGRDSGGTTEQIDHEKTGLLYDGTVDDLAKCICELYKNRNKMEELARNGYEEAVEKHTRGNCYKKVEAVIDEVLEL